MNSDDIRKVPLDELFAAVDDMDTDTFLTFLSDDVSFRFGSAPVAEGKQAVGEAVSAFFGAISGLRHTIARSWGADDTLACEGAVRYTRHDGSEIEIPFVNVFETADGLIEDYRIYIDIAPLFAEQ